MGTFARFCDRTTVHGLPDFLSAGTKGRIFWAAFLLGFSALCSVQMARLCVTFFREEIGTQTNAILPNIMPSTIICPSDWMNLTSEAGVEPADQFKMRKYMSGYLPWYTTEYIISAITKGEDIRSDVEDQYNKEKDWAQSKDMRSYMMEQVSGLHDKGIEVRLMIPGLKRLDWEPFVNYHGPCLRYYTNETFNDLQIQSSGMVVRLRVPKDNRLDNRPTSFLLSVSGKLDPRPMNFQKSESLPFGYEFSIKFSPLLIKREDKRWEACKQWSRSDRMACIIRHGNDRCHKEMEGSNLGNCITYVPPTEQYPEEQTENLCNLFDMSQMNEITDLCYAKTLQQNSAEWSKICPVPCTDEWFQFTYQTVRKVSDDSTTVISLQTESSGGFEVAQYFTMNTETLLSGVGGTLGLWLGASVLSVVQAFYLMCHRPDRKTEGEEM